MSERKKRGFWRFCRIGFRYFRIMVWLLLLLVLGSLIYFNQVGLPDFLKQPLLEKLRARGLVLQFSRLRLRWYEGIVAENVRFGGTDAPLLPTISTAELQVLLNWKALARGQLQIDAVALRQGRLVWPVQESSGLKELSIEGIQTHLRFIPEDQWVLDDFKARLAGARIALSGAVTNASAVRDWKFIHERQPAPAGLWQKRLRSLAATLEKIRFATSPELRLDLRGDARDLQSFSVRLVLDAPGAQTPWGAFSQTRFTGRVFPADTNGVWHSAIELEAAGAQTRWAATTNLQLELHLATAEDRTNVVQCEARLSASQIQCEWASGSNALFTARWVHTLTNPLPLSGEGRLACERARSRWANAHELQFTATLRPPSEVDPPLACDDSWGFWTNLQPYSLAWQCQARTVQASNVTASQIACEGSWHAPELNVSNLQARLYDGQVVAGLDVNVAARRLHARLDSDVDPHKVAALLSDEGRRWLADYWWDKAPQVQGEISIALPAWTNRQPDWRAEVQPSLVVQGQFQSQSPAGYRQVRVESVQSHFLYSNMCWHLPDLALTFREGRLAATHHADDRSGDFYSRIRSTIDLRTVRPLLDPDQQHGLDLLTCGRPPAIEAELWGRFHEPERLGFRGRVALTNFSFRGQTGDWLTTAVQYTNRVLQFFEPQIQRGTQYISAEGVMADFNAQLVYLTNAFSTAEPLVIARAIGEKIGRAIEPYQFRLPPLGFVHGTIPMHGEQGADLHFLLDGGPFDWWKFHLPHVAGHLHWKDLRLEMDDLHASFYGGEADGKARFDFLEDHPTTLSFQVNVTNALLRPLVADLRRTNQLEGRLSGTLVVAQGNTEDRTSVKGYGHLALRDGLIWDIPLFGIFSPVLNGIMPGLGNSRATGGTCSFAITNGVLTTDDLDIRTATMHLRYRGSVDWDSRLNARVEAILLRDMWIVGPMISTVFWPVSKMFEYKLQGTLTDPKAEPVFIIPRILLLPFHPLKSLKGSVPEEAGSSTNAPPPFRSPK